MAIAIEAYSIVALKERIEDNYEGGLQAFSSLISNGTVLADDDLWRCSFMVPEDAGHFLEQASQGGLNTSQGPDPDLVVVCEHDLSVVPYCEWLQVVQWQKGVVAWREGTTPVTVVAREGWSPEQGSGLNYLASADSENLEFRRIENGVHVYFDKEHGREVHVARSGPDHNAIFQNAAQIVEDYGDRDERPLGRKTTLTQVRAALNELDSLASVFPNWWPVFYFIGKGRRAIGELERAYQAFHRAFELNEQREEILVNLGGICLELGKPAEAVQVAQKAASMLPDNPQTLGNLACAYLVAGKIPEAAATINAAHKLSAEAPVCQQLEVLKKLIDEVVAGRRDQPEYLRDLWKPPRPSKVPGDPSTSPPVKLVPLEVRPQLPTLWDCFIKFWRGF